MSSEPISDEDSRKKHIETLREAAAELEMVADYHEAAMYQYDEQDLRNKYVRERLEELGQSKEQMAMNKLGI